MLFSVLRQSSRPVLAQPDERHANRTASVLKWYDRNRHTISRPNEEKYTLIYLNFNNKINNLKCTDSFLVGNLRLIQSLMT